jgi:hypothetical protein
MVWRLFATKLETAETMEVVALNMRAPHFYPDNCMHGLMREGRRIPALYSTYGLP